MPGPSIPGVTPPTISAAAAEPESYYQNLFASRYGASAGNAYRSYNAAHPGSTPYQNANTFLELILVHGLDQAIAEGLGGSAAALGQIPQAAATGAQNAFKALTAPITTVAAFYGKIGKFLDDLTSGSFWMRIAEAIAGLVLLAIGVNALFKGAPLKVVTKGAALAAKVVPGHG